MVERIVQDRNYENDGANFQNIGSESEIKEETGGAAHGKGDSGESMIEAPPNVALKS